MFTAHYGDAKASLLRPNRELGAHSLFGPRPLFDRTLVYMDRVHARLRASPRT